MIGFEGFFDLNNSLFICYKSSIILNLKDLEEVRIHLSP